MVAIPQSRAREIVCDIPKEGQLFKLFLKSGGMGFREE